MTENIQEGNKIKHHSVSAINRFFQNIPAYTPEEKYINSCLKSTNKFVKNNQNIFISGQR